MSFTHEVHLEYNGTVFSLLQDFEVQVNGITVSTPVRHPSGVVIRNIGSQIVSILTFYKLTFKPA